MKRLVKTIEKNISGRKVLGLFLITSFVYVFMLAFTIPETMLFSSGLKLLDMMPTGYDLNYVNLLFNTLGESGRETYLTTQIPVDMLYPLFFGISYCLVMGYFLKKLNKLNTAYSYLCILPIISGIADYFENFGIIVMLSKYPHLTQALVTTVSLFSVVKSTSTSLFFISLIIVLIALGYKIVRGRVTSTNAL